VQRELTKKELTDLARQRGIKGYSAMTKAQLESALGVDSLEFKAEIAKEPTDKPKKPTKAAPKAEESAKKPVAKATAKKTTEKPSDKSKTAKAPPEKPTVKAESKSATKATTKVSAKSPAPVVEKVVKAAEPKADETKVAPAKEEAIAPAKPKSVLVPAEALATAEPEVEETTAESTETTDATELVPTKPKAPPLKKTWTNHELLIDEGLEPLPPTYPTDKIVILTRDPLWIHAYWELTAATVDRAKSQGGQRLTMRVHDVTDILFNGANAHYTFDVAMPFDFQRMWYLNVPTDGRTYLAEIGYLSHDGRFFSLAMSNPTAVPIGRVSPIVADRFATIEVKAPVEESYEPVRDLPRTPAPVPEMTVEEPTYQPTSVGSQPELGERMATESLRGISFWSADIPKFGDYMNAGPMSSAALSLWSRSSAEFNRPPQRPEKKKDFWLVADCELIVYGATDPDAKVTLRGQDIRLRPDGTFSMRFVFPDGLHPIPIHAVNADGDMERAITITVSRDTQVLG
jgi:hypothetical protein